MFILKLIGTRICSIAQIEMLSLDVIFIFLYNFIINDSIAKDEH
jgi:hypothetical protein